MCDLFLFFQNLNLTKTYKCILLDTVDGPSWAEMVSVFVYYIRDNK